MSGKLGQYRSPKCSECGHAMKYHRSVKRWRCIWCPYECSDDIAKTLYEQDTGQENVPDINDAPILQIFGSHPQQPQPAMTPGTPASHYDMRSEK